MYDVASRTIVIKSTTGPSLGPNTYVTCNPRLCKQNCAPFLSSQEKASSFIPKLNTDAVYDIRSHNQRIIGGASLKSKTPRFIYKCDDIPGPTLYTPKPIKCIRNKLKLDPTKPKLYQCAVPYSISIIAPSIPSKIDENGYELDKDGNIIKIPPDVKIPNEINIPSELGQTKAWKWSQRTSRRFHFKQFETYGPGPAAYFAQLPKCPKAEADEEYREMARRFSFLPRFLEAQELKACKENRPGPGDYNIPNNWIKQQSKSINPKPFIRSAARFKNLEVLTPSPTDYNVCDCSKVKKQFSVKCVAFGVNAPRFKTKKLVDSPGPGDYDIKAPLQEKIELKKNKFALCEPPFNSTALRDLNFAAKDAIDMPSAADYPEDVESVDLKQEIYSSVFKNRVCRFFSPADKRDYIGPAKYNVAESFHKNEGRKFFSVAEVAFNSSGPRSTTPTVKYGVPCSTTYNVGKDRCRFQGFSFAVSPRFRCVKESPGPGQYQIHPRIEQSTYKAIDTSNLRLKENVIRKKLRTAPSETRKMWMNILKKKKLLRWFDVELDYEERMNLLVQKLFDKPV